jgi:hypothetical protein
MMIIPETDPTRIVWWLVLNAILAAESFSGWSVAGFLVFTLSLAKSIISTINRTMATTITIQIQADIFNLLKIL